MLKCNRIIKLFHSALVFEHVRMVSTFLHWKYFDGNGLDGYLPPSMIGRKGESLWQKQDTFHASIYFAALRKTVTNWHATHPILHLPIYKYICACKNDKYPYKNICVWAFKANNAFKVNQNTFYKCWRFTLFILSTISHHVFTFFLLSTPLPFLLCQKHFLQVCRGACKVIPVKNSNNDVKRAQCWPQHTSTNNQT